MKKLTFILEQLGTRVPGGIGRYSVELFNALSKSVPNGWSLRGQLPPSLSLENSQLTAEAKHFTYVRNNPLSTRALSRLWSMGIDRAAPTTNFHAPSLLSPLAKYRFGYKNVVTIHDTVPWSFPETLTPHGVRWHIKMAEKAIENAEAIVAPTQSVKAELLELFDIEDRLFVIPGASSFNLRESETPSQKELPLPEKYFLIVGTLEPRKGIREAIQASMLSDTIPLVHIGPLGWGGVDVSKILFELGASSNAFIDLGFVAENFLAHIFKGATAIIQPSFSEGFGLPVLEAMSLGTPAIISDVPALLEVSGDAALVVERENPDFVFDLAQKMSSLAQNNALREELSQLSIEASKHYSWEKSAQKVWELHQQLSE